MYFDTHCHLNSEEMFENRRAFIEKAREADVQTFCVVRITTFRGIIKR